MAVNCRSRPLSGAAPFFASCCPLGLPGAASRMGRNMLCRERIERVAAARPFNAANAAKEIHDGPGLADRHRPRAYNCRRSGCPNRPDTMARPIAAIGLGNRKRAGLVALAGLCLAYGGVALLNHYCDPTIPCNRCSANRLPLITPVHACMRPVAAQDAGRDGPR